MNTLHIVMIGVPAHGHMNPHLPVLAELVARGHRVEVTTPSGFAPAVAATGATVVPVTSVLPDEDRGETWPEDPVAGMARFLDELTVYARMGDTLSYASLALCVLVAFWPSRRSHLRT